MLQLRAFEPEFLAQLDRLVLGVTRARTIRAGRRSLGRIQGSGVEPENFREYVEGDDLRFLDWNTFARLDSLTIRTFRVERQVEATILIDASASMGLPAPDEKLGFALLLGAAIAYIAMSENDPVRLAVFNHRPGQRYLRLTRFHQRHETYLDFRRFVAGIKPEGGTAMRAAVGELLAERRAPGIAVVISDFLTEAVEYEGALGALLAAGYEVKAVQIIGGRESRGKYPPGAYRIRDSETGAVREITFDAAAAAACRARIEERAAQLSQFCAKKAIAHALAIDAAQADAIIRREFPGLGVIA